MPQAAQYLTALIPLRTSCASAQDRAQGQLLPLVAFGAVIFTLSVLRFRKQLD